MSRGYFFVFPRITCLIVTISIFTFFVFAVSLSSAQALRDVELISPAPGIEVIGKRPEIVCRADNFDANQNVIVLLDGTDVTGIITDTFDGFSFTPVEILNPGPHVLTIMITGADGNPVQKEFAFSTRHSDLFEEASTKNDLSLACEKTLEKPNEANFQTSYKIESNLGNESVIGEKAWQIRSNTNLRYLTQNLAVSAPLEKGINLANYLVSGAYNGDRFQANTEIGDVSVNETQNTVNLARRGGTFSTNYKAFKIKTFAVNSEEVFGFKEGTGIGGNSDDHIMGVSGEAGLFSDKVKLKTVYADGGEKAGSYSTYNADDEQNNDPYSISTPTSEQNNPYSMYSSTSDKKGSVLGLLLSSNFFDNKLNTEAELDFSDYDADTSDEFGYEKDNAWKLGANGNWNAYSYGAVYERLGKDYQVIGNPYIQADREGETINFGATYPIHAAMISLSKYNDNVDGDDLYARTDSTQGQFQYMFTKFASLPLGLMYQRAQIESSDEPEYTPHMENITDAVSATMNYLRGPWNLGFQAGFSDQNDKTPQDYDTEAVNYSVSPTYYSEYISISPSMSFIRSRYRPTNTRTDTQTATLDLRGNLWDQRITYECAGMFSHTESNDDAIKQDICGTNFRIAYILAKKMWGIANPSTGFMGYYNTTEDHVYNTRTHDFTLLLVFSASMPFAF